MKPDELQNRWVAAARAYPPSDAVPYAFEKRVMAHLKTRAKADLWTIWNQMLWRAAVPCVAIMMMVSAWTYLLQNGAAPGNTLVAELENVVFAPVAALEDSW
jgi:anti-sigma-K factor RskA